MALVMKLATIENVVSIVVIVLQSVLLILYILQEKKNADVMPLNLAMELVTLNVLAKNVALTVVIVTVLKPVRTRLITMDNATMTVITRTVTSMGLIVSAHLGVIEAGWAMAIAMSYVIRQSAISMPLTVNAVQDAIDHG
jgi:hypothetical protein